MVKKVTCSCGQRFGNDEQHRIHALKHGPSTHQRVRGPVTFADAVAAGDGTLHGAIDHWQDRAKTAEARLAEAEALREDAQCYHHLVGLINANRTAFAGEVLDWFMGEKR